MLTDEINVSTWSTGSAVTVGEESRVPGFNLFNRDIRLVEGLEPQDLEDLVDAIPITTDLSAKVLRNLGVGNLVIVRTMPIFPHLMY